MYQIFANNAIIFDDTTPLPSLKVIEPKLTLEDNNAGSLVFKLPPGNVAYDSITCMTTEVIVKQDDVEIWRGRVITEETDFWKCKKYTAEGELAYLNDTIQLPAKYTTSNTTVASFLRSLLTKHNSQIGNSGINKVFNVDNTGPAITVDDGDTLDDSSAINRYTNYETTLKCINEKLVDKLGGHLRIRHQGGKRYLDYLEDYTEIGASDQEIRFGVNLLDYVSNLDSVDWVTAICPRGKRLEIDEKDQPIAGLEAYTNVSTAAADGSWHTAGSYFVTNANMVSQYGFISAVVDWDEVTDVTILRNKAKKYLQSVVFDQLCLEISAVDLHYLNPSIETLKIQETVRCISEPHGMDTSFPVTKVEIDLNNPSNTKYTLGTKVSSSLTAAQNKANSALTQYVNDTFVPTESKILTEAQATATSLINGAAAGGVASWMYGTDGNGNALIDQTAATPKVPTGIRVANAQKDANATNRWLWTTGGLGHYKRNNTSTLWKNVNVNVAMTMDGKIVADRITTGCIKLTGAANRANNSWDTTGQTASTTLVPTFLQTYNSSGSLIGRWGSDGIWLANGTISIGTKRNVTFYDADGNATTESRCPFEVDSNGIVYATNGKFTGTVSSANIFGSAIKGTTFYLKQYNTNHDHGRSGSYDIVDISSGKLKTQGTWIQLCQDVANEDIKHVGLGVNRWAYHENGVVHIEVTSRTIFDLFYWWDSKAEDYKNSIVECAKYWAEHGEW